MTHARAVYAADPSRVSSIRAEALASLPKPLPPSPEELDFSERVDRAVVQSMSMLVQAEEQLAAPISAFLPSEQTASELADKSAEQAWHQKYELVDGYTDRMLEKSQELFADVMLLIDGHEQSDVPLPDDTELPTPPPSPLLLQLNVPGGVKTWVAASQKATRASLRKADGIGARPATSPPSSPGAVPTCREQFAPCRAAIIDHAEGTRLPGTLPCHCFRFRR